mmetsp:Transcript_66837/g.159493  ORF Transcript_66837/g.159493 Transcript_66837/m.159493 type:complete len:91 (-) Transcript_66837:117-389(-)
MVLLRTLGLAALLGVLQTQAVTVRPKLDNHRCKVMCQRFGMKALGEEFQNILDPTKCATQCDKVHPAKVSKDTVALASKPERATSLPQKR